MNIAIIGLGFRGSENIKTLCRIDGVKIISICDLYEERIERAKNYLLSSGHDPAASLSYKTALGIKGLDAAFVFTGWQSHSEIAIYAMKIGIPRIRFVTIRSILSDVVSFSFAFLTVVPTIF